MSWPIFIELILQMLVGNIDQIMLSNYNSTAVAAVGNANQIMTTLILTFNVVSLAATIMLSRYLGANDNLKVNQIYSLAVFINLIISFAITIALILGADGIFAIMRLPKEVIPEAKSYLTIASLSLPCQALMLTFSAFLRAHAKMVAIMFSTGIINLINIAGNAAFIYGIGPLPKMGAAGAALSTSICRTVGMIMVMFVFFKTVEGANLNFKLLKPFPKDLFNSFLGIGLPSAGEGFSYNMSQSTSLVFVNMIGTYAVTARMYSGMFAQISYMLVFAVSQGASIITGYCIGAKEYDTADKLPWMVLKAFTPVTIVISVLMAVFSTQLFSLFSKDAAVIALGSQVMIVDIFLEIGRCLNIVLVRNLQAVGDVKFPVTIGIISQWVLGVGAAYILGMYLGLGLAGVWIAFALDEIIRGIIFIFRWKSGKWKKIKTV